VELRCLHLHVFVHLHEEEFCVQERNKGTRYTDEKGPVDRKVCFSRMQSMNAKYKYHWCILQSLLLEHGGSRKKLIEGKVVS